MKAERAREGVSEAEAERAREGLGEPVADAAEQRTASAPQASDTTEPSSADRPRTKAAQREATTAALIQVARELFAERGYAGVGTEEIVQRAGVTRGALYHHFRNGKEELFRAVLVQVSAEIVQRVAEAASATDDPWEELILGSEAFLDACATPEVQRIVLLDAPAVLGWDVRRAIDADYGLRLLEGAIQNAMDAGRLLPGSASAVAHVLSGALDEAAMVVARAEDPAAARAEMSVTLRRLLEGLRPPTA